MSFVEIAKLYAASFGVFIIVDLIWLGVVARGFYQEQIGFLLKANVNWLAAIVFYLLFVAGVVYFVTLPAVHASSLQQAVLGGIFFGLVTYAAYDLTNLATLDRWPIIVTVVDMIWGGVLCMTVSVSGFLFWKHWVS